MHACIGYARRHDEAKHVQAWFAAGVFCMLPIPISIFDIAQHLRHWWVNMAGRYLLCGLLPQYVCLFSPRA